MHEEAMPVRVRRQQISSTHQTAKNCRLGKTTAGLCGTKNKTAKHNGAENEEMAVAVLQEEVSLD